LSEANEKEKVTMRMSKPAVILVVSLTLAAPMFASPSQSAAPGRDGGGVISRVWSQIKHYVLKSLEQPGVPIPDDNH
jgi:hypothetical protein